MNDRPLQYKQDPNPGSQGQGSLRPIAWAVLTLVGLVALASLWFFSGSARQSLQAAQQPSGLFSTSQTGVWNLQFDAYASSPSSKLLPSSATAEEMMEHVYALIYSAQYLYLSTRAFDPHHR